MTDKLKFGLSLDLINRHVQEPNRNRYESRYYWEELYPLISTAGFQGIEIPYEPIWMFGGRSGVPMTRYCITAKYHSIDNYVEFLHSKGIEKVIGIHFDPTLFMRNDSLDFYFGASQHFASEAIRFAGEIGAGYLTLTPTPAFGLVEHYHGDKSNWEECFLEKTTVMISALSEVAKECGVRLNLRSEYWSLLRGNSFFDFLESVSDDVRFDLDTAHGAISGSDPILLLQEKIDKVGCIHLTDTSFVDESNVWQQVNPEFPAPRATQVFRDPGEGTVDLDEFCRTLAQKNYDDWVVISCRQTRDPMRSLLRCRQATYRWLNQSEEV